MDRCPGREKVAQTLSIPCEGNVWLFQSGLLTLLPPSGLSTPPLQSPLHIFPRHYYELLWVRQLKNNTMVSTFIVGKKERRKEISPLVLLLRTTEDVLEDIFVLFLFFFFLCVHFFLINKNFYAVDFWFCIFFCFVFYAVDFGFVYTHSHLR